MHRVPGHKEIRFPWGPDLTEVSLLIDGLQSKYQRHDIMFHTEQQGRDTHIDWTGHEAGWHMEIIINSNEKWQGRNSEPSAPAPPPLGRERSLPPGSGFPGKDPLGSDGLASLGPFSRFPAQEGTALGCEVQRRTWVCTQGLASWSPRRAGGPRRQGKAPERRWVELSAVHDP